MQENDIKNKKTNSDNIAESGIDKKNNLKKEKAQQCQTASQDNKCPVCGTPNDAEAIYCANCGASLKIASCPLCGSPIDPDADYCEVCNHYIKSDTCSFCGAHMDETDFHCPECGSPRGGIVCPICHTVNEFSFCKECGYPLTEGAKKELSEIKSNPVYKEMIRMATEINDLNNRLPYANANDKAREHKNSELRVRVLSLLEKDKGVENPKIAQIPSKRMEESALEQLSQYKKLDISMLLEKLQTVPTPNPAKARNFAMACKPLAVNVGWECNYKHAIHSSPCMCAKPQLGGKWVISDGKDNKK
jgi:predicted amidophosphoribosyltransferase